MLYRQGEEGITIPVGRGEEEDTGREKRGGRDKSEGEGRKMKT